MAKVTQLKSNQDGLQGSCQTHLDLSTGHITEIDNSLLKIASSHYAKLNVALRVVGYEYGYYITLLAEPCEYRVDREGWNRMLAAGLSVEFCNLIRSAAERGIGLIVLDRDAEINPNLPTFNW